jgi:uncharacterized cupredoxin-like copper-binding protein
MRQLTIRPILTLAVVAITSLGVVQFASARTEPQAHASATTISVSGKEFSFKLSKTSIAKPGKVTFNFKNVGHVKHDFSINHKGTPMIGPGKTARLAVTFKKKGKYSYLCTVPGHAAAGMRGVFTVR